MPDDHPPVEVPDDVRKVIAKLADAAKEKPDDLEVWQQLGFVQYRAGQVDPDYLADAPRHLHAHPRERSPRTSMRCARSATSPSIATIRPRAMELLPALSEDQAGRPRACRPTSATMLLVEQAGRRGAEGLPGRCSRVDPKFFQAQFNLAIAYRAAGDDAPRRWRRCERAREHRRPTTRRASASTRCCAAPSTAAPRQPRARAAPAAATAAGGDLHGDVEAIFRAHPIVGPEARPHRLAERRRARVLLREFPMDGHAADGAREVHRPHPHRRARQQDPSSGDRAGHDRAGRRRQPAASWRRSPSDGQARSPRYLAGDALVVRTGNRVRSARD